MATVSFVYFNLGVNVLASILFILFFLYAWNEKEKIYQCHDTISSFCASKDSWGNRFLLSFTCIVGVNMLCLHVEEYNSRPSEFNALFWIEIACIFPLPLVGICYTRGKKYDELARDDILREFIVKKSEDLDGYNNNKNDYKNEYDYNDSVDCGVFKFPITISERIHDISSTVFFVGLTFSTFYYTLHLIVTPHHFEQSPKIIIALFVTSCLNVIGLISYSIVNKILIEFLNKRSKQLRICSFVLECFVGAIVVILDTICSIRRNRNVTWP